MTILKKILPFGEIMVSLGVITKEQLDIALKEGKKTNTRVGKVLVNLGFAVENDIANALAVQYQIPAVILSSTILDPAVVKLIPESVARRYLVIPIAVDGDVLQVAMIDPLNVFAIDEIKRATRYKIKTIVTTETEITNAINQYYPLRGFDPPEIPEETAKTATPTLPSPVKGAQPLQGEEIWKRSSPAGAPLLKEEEAGPEKPEKIAGGSSVAQLIDQLISTAVQDSASDIHIEPDEGELRVRMRIDGVLGAAIDFPPKLHTAVISRLKIMCNLDMGEKTLPQYGRCFLKVADKDIDIRLSTLPTIFGEKAVMRIQDKTRAFLDIERLTPVEDTLEALKKAIKKPSGMILLAGPAGSGRTTTAYALINLLNTADKNIVTVEDPVEYHMKRVNQVEVNPEAGVTFTSALRHVLRQDPDIIMIGDMQGKETAETAMHASLTGRVVISTIHMDSAVGTVSRLLDMGIEPYLVSSSIMCIVGQRLVRKICDSCRQSYEADPAVLKEMGLKAASMKNAMFSRGAGCADCKGTGLKGRTGIFEVLLLDDGIRAMINSRADSKAILDAAKKKGFLPLRADGIRAVLAGRTTVEEVIQATQMLED